MSDSLAPEQISRLKRLILKKGAEVNEKLTALLAGQTPSLHGLLDAKPGETPIERLQRFMKVLDDALARIREGRYGTCSECGAELGYVALEQMPWADTCTACATRQLV
jgi:hypothetical protein